MLSNIESRFSRTVTHEGLDGFYDMFPWQSVLFEFEDGFLAYCATCDFETWWENPDPEWMDTVIELGERDSELAAQIGAKNVWVADE